MSATSGAKVRHYVGLDLGQASDPTAVVMLEQRPLEEPAAPPPPPSEGLIRGKSCYTQDEMFAWQQARAREPKTPPGGKHSYRLVLADRFRLGTSYPDVVERVGKLLRALPGFGTRRSGPVGTWTSWDTAPRLVVDATGVGRPVVDMLARARLAPIAITIHGGDTVTRADDGGWRVPKRALVTTCQVLLQTERMRFAEQLELLPMLTRELQDFKVRIDPVTAHDSYGAWREGQHDDLVLATAIAAWWAEQEREYEPTFVPPSTSYSAFGADLGFRRR